MITEIKNRIRALVQKYEQSKDVYRTARFNETQVRNEFLDPLFEILGWDIRNTAGKNTNEREDDPAKQVRRYGFTVGLNKYNNTTQIN